MCIRDRDNFVLTLSTAVRATDPESLLEYFQGLGPEKREWYAKNYDNESPMTHAWYAKNFAKNYAIIVDNKVVNASSDETSEEGV